MAQLFTPGADALYRLALMTGVACLVGLPVLAAGIVRSNYVTGVGVAPAQPVPFSHKHHSGELGHRLPLLPHQVEREATAGIPPTQTCMTCHSQIWTGSDMLEPVRDSYAQDKPLRLDAAEQAAGLRLLQPLRPRDEGHRLLDLPRRRRRRCS